MRISFVIPAHDEAALIGPTVDAARAAAESLGLPYEVVVAADACTDDTERIAAARGATVVCHARRQIAATRNLGARAATGDLLVFVDADTRVQPAALAEAVVAVRAGAVGGGGPVRMDGPLPLYGRVMMPVLTWVFRRLNLTGGAFLFCTRAAFDAAGGWDERYYAAEELHLARRLKRVGRFALVRTPVVTSGRKLRTHTFFELAGVLVRGLLVPGSLRDRARLAFFYGRRRADPHRP